MEVFDPAAAGHAAKGAFEGGHPAVQRAHLLVHLEQLRTVYRVGGSGIHIALGDVADLAGAAAAPGAVGAQRAVPEQGVVAQGVDRLVSGVQLATVDRLQAVGADFAVGHIAQGGAGGALEGHRGFAGIVVLHRVGGRRGGDRLQLAQVDRVGGVGAGGDVGDLPLERAVADRDAVGAVGQAAGAEGDAVGGGRLGLGAEGQAARTVGAGVGAQRGAPVGAGAGAGAEGDAVVAARPGFRAEGDARVAVGVRLVAEGHGVFAVGLGLVAHGDAASQLVLADGVDQRSGAVADGDAVLRLGPGTGARGQGVAAAGAGVGQGRVDVEVVAGVVHAAGQRIELCLVDRVGGVGAGGDVGDLALERAVADRDAVGAVGQAVGAECHAVGDAAGRHLGAGANGHAVVGARRGLVAQGDRVVAPAVGVLAGRQGAAAEGVGAETEGRGVFAVRPGLRADGGRVGADSLGCDAGRQRVESTGGRAAAAGVGFEVLAARGVEFAERAVDLGEAVLGVAGRAAGAGQVVGVAQQIGWGVQRVTGAVVGGAQGAGGGVAQGVELAEVDRVAGLAAGGDIGDLPLGVRGAYRDAVAAIGSAIGAQRDTVGMTGQTPLPDCDAVHGGGLGETAE
ncbi:hypothetical protein D9M68_531480 [compost metagenome]